MPNSVRQELCRRRQIGPGIVHNMGQPIGALTEQGCPIRSLPAALRHPRRQSREETKPGHGFRGRQDCHYQPVISVQEGTWLAFIETDQNYSARVGVVAEPRWERGTLR
jgi:hypothetical protein